MSAAASQRYDEGRLRKAAGEKMFARGQGCAAHGQVVLLSAGADGVLAAAFGTSDYTVWLKARGPGVSGQCTCPAFEDTGLCKHMVATALLANEAAEAGEIPPDGMGVVAAQIDRLERRQLEKMLVNMAKADWRVLRSLHLELGLDWEHDVD